MARPPKQNADYFSHDNDMRNDEKIKAVRLRFKHEGYSIWNMLLEKLCKAKDFTLCYSDLNIEMWAGDFDIEPDRLKEIIEYFLKIELILLHDGLIFSETMIIRFSGLLSKRKRQSAALSTAIIKNKEVMGSDNPQSKVKESKVNKRKLKEIKVKENTKEELLPSGNSLYKNFIEAYDLFIKSKTGFPAKIDEVQGASMKKLIQYLSNASKEKTEEGGLKTWQYILNNWGSIEDFYQSKLKLTEINSNIVNILAQIKNGKKNGPNNNTKNLNSTINIGSGNKMGKL